MISYLESYLKVTCTFIEIIRNLIRMWNGNWCRVVDCLWHRFGCCLDIKMIESLSVSDEKFGHTNSGGVFRSSEVICGRWRGITLFADLNGDEGWCSISCASKCCNGYSKHNVFNTWSIYMFPLVSHHIVNLSFLKGHKFFLRGSPNGRSISAQ